MNNKNSKIYLCKDINLDREYKNVLSYTEQEMLTLCIEKSLASASNFTFIRPDRNEIQVEFSYATCLQCNYMAFQNPNYSNKWFFAFIDEVSYIGDKTTKISFTVDEHATWYDYWYTKPCLVLREHVNSDMIGEHTYPENLEHGPYIINDYNKIIYTPGSTEYVVVGTTWLPSNTPNLPSVQYYGGIFSGVYYLAFDSMQYAKNFILAMDGLGRGSNIIHVFMAPSYLCQPSTFFQADLQSKETWDNGTVHNKTFHIETYIVTSNSGSILLTNYAINLNSTLNGYTPKNNKLYTGDYNYLLISNGVGNDAIFKYEDFVSNQPLFNAYGVLCPGCSIKLYPVNYRKYNDDGYILNSGFNEGLTGAKYPICSYPSDTYINWLTQQSVNTKMNLVQTGVRIASTLLAGGEDVSSGGLFNQQASYLSERYQHALVGKQVEGNINAGDVSFASNHMYFTYYKMSIKSEYARKIDAYFNKFGYQVNEIKSPNVTGRTYWNFIQIGPYEEIGYSNNLGSVPAKSMDTINRIYRNGVTIWHDHANIGNYSLSNTII